MRRLRSLPGLIFSRRRRMLRRITGGLLHIRILRSRVMGRSRTRGRRRRGLRGRLLGVLLVSCLFSARYGSG
ncbi:hypothetical protein BJX66DRAFT_315851 [Aspergillus keveii]|uniref:Uncharacterized protein n=1 Tax=Aspergillus keveii TaxID=714993 RepID=A0ABR4FNT7_9EURO